MKYATVFTGHGCMKAARPGAFHDPLASVVTCSLQIGKGLAHYGLKFPGRVHVTELDLKEHLHYPGKC